MTMTELPSISGTASFFHALAPVLVANILTVVFVYCFATINQQEQRGEEGRLSYIWHIVNGRSRTSAIPARISAIGAMP